MRAGWEVQDHIWLYREDTGDPISKQINKSSLNPPSPNNSKTFKQTNKQINPNSLKTYKLGVLVHVLGGWGKMMASFNACTNVRAHTHTQTHMHAWMQIRLGVGKSEEDNMRKGGLWDGSVSKSACCSAWRPEFDAWGTLNTVEGEN